MVPINKVKEIIIKHDSLEKELSAGSIDPKLFVKKSLRFEKNVIKATARITPGIA